MHKMGTYHVEVWEQEAIYEGDDPIINDTLIRIGDESTHLLKETDFSLVNCLGAICRMLNSEASLLYSDLEDAKIALDDMTHEFAQSQDELEDTKRELIQAEERLGESEEALDKTQAALEEMQDEFDSNTASFYQIIESN